MVDYLLDLQGGFTKYLCFLCLWNSRASNQHYVTRGWLAHKELSAGKYNKICDSLILAERVLLPPFQIKHGLVKQFVKALDSQSSGFQNILCIFPKLSDAKLKAGVFTGPQIRCLLDSEDLETTISNLEIDAW